MNFFIASDKSIQTQTFEGYVGMIHVYVQEDEKNIYFSCFQVNEEFRTKGYGRILLNEAFSKTKELYPDYSFELDAMPSFFTENDFSKTLKRLTRFYLKSFQDFFREIRLIPNSNQKEKLSCYRIIAVN